MQYFDNFDTLCNPTTHINVKKQVMYLKFHRADPVENFSQVFTDHGPGDFIVTLCGRLNSMACHVIEGNHVGQDTHRLIKWTESEI